MPKFSENYYLRKCFFERDQVPTQSAMRNTMGTSLADVYFKSMTPALKVLAGLEPPMKGGGSDWYMPPTEILKGRAVLKPLKKEYLSKLSYNGIAFFAETLVENYRKGLQREKQKMLDENDEKWRKIIQIRCQQEWEDGSLEASKRNTVRIQQAFQDFTNVYRRSLTKIETIVSSASLKEVERVKNEAYNKMEKKCNTLLKQQATMLYDRYQNSLTIEKNKYKERFIENIESIRTDFENQFHDINVEKHMAVEKLRSLLECQNLACQIYVALKERDEFNKEMEDSKHKHKKTIKVIKDKIDQKDVEIRIAEEKLLKQKEFNRVWRKKICHVVKNFQEFVKYCLNALPEHADFFINMEKLMLLQLGEASENPSVESIFEPEKHHFSTPIPRPHPYFLICDKGYKPKIDADLCPKHCTSSASQFPVIIVNKRCVYAACKSFEIFSDKVKEFIDGQRGDDDDFIDDHDYTYDVPINCTSSDQLLQLQLESSLMQILQKEMPNVKHVPVECGVCKIPYCFCSPDQIVNMNYNYLYHDVDIDDEKADSLKNIKTEYKIITRTEELKHTREPKIESYIDYIRPKKCKCKKTAMKHLNDRLPAYMRNTSTFENVTIPNYEPCDVDQLRKLVKKSSKWRPPTPAPSKQESKTRNVSTQYLEPNYDALCYCFSDEEVKQIYTDLITGMKVHKEPKFTEFDKSLPSTHLDKRPSSFATKAALSLRKLIEKSPDLEEIFKSEHCNY